MHAGASRWAAWAGAVLLAFLAFVGAARAQGRIAYTVQVAALSDSEAAIEQSGALLREGFPAYVVRAEGEAGAVFRIRVGAFGDRRSADRYAAGMGERAGGTPRPALAEAIPAGILPLAPTSVMRLSHGARAVLLPWGEEGFAVRVGPADAEAEYRPLESGRSFVALWAERRDEGRAELVRVPLDGEAELGDPEEVREALFRQRLRLIADRSELPLDGLRAAVRGEPGERYLLAWRTLAPEVRERGVLRPDAPPSSRSDEDWLGEVPPAPVPPAEVLVPASRAAEASAADEDGGEGSGEAADPASPDSEPNGVNGDGWYAEAEGRWTVIEARGTSWRALVGTPKGGAGDLLVLEVEGGTELVRLIPR